MAWDSTINIRNKVTYVAIFSINFTSWLEAIPLIPGNLTSETKYRLNNSI